MRSGIWEDRSGIWGDRSGIWGDRSSINADQNENLVRNLVRLSTFSLTYS